MKKKIWNSASNLAASPSAGQSAGRATSAGHVLTDDELARGCFCRKPK